jgi:hypothetical protein
MDSIIIENICKDLSFDVWNWYTHNKYDIEIMVKEIAGFCKYMEDSFNKYESIRLDDNVRLCFKYESMYREIIVKLFNAKFKL